MNKLLCCRQLIVGFIVGFAISSAFAQEWTKKESGRTEYVQDRTACAQQSQQMALVGDELQKDIADCLAGKGWQRNQVNEALSMYCEEKPAARSCKRGGTAEIYTKDRAECWDQVLKTVGNTYSRPGWMGLGGLLISSVQAEENKKALQASQMSGMKICLEGKAWTVEFKEVPQTVEPAKSSNNLQR